ncbi:hypothetical protein K1T71_012744 [Dendrolimus kikuchii]|uniref:Uncharacterized protein n=1 Tax=Dendrolimus kikuchii TaxID=765133 RepID=A0ACC1CKL4_9NEOP|nr:hypothetical protein K1T71_012744 [Dendrolimus kikuchii]
MKCAGCLKINKDLHGLKCTTSSCGKIFCSLCINVSLNSEQKKTWICPDCCPIQKRGGDNSSTPIRSSAEMENVTMRKKINTITESVEIRELAAVMSRLTNEFSCLKTQLKEVTDSLSHCHERMDELVRSINSSKNRLKTLEKRDLELIKLEGAVERLQSDLNIQEQINLRNELEIVGISEINNENLEDIGKLAAQKVGVKLEEGDVDWVTRAGPRFSTTMKNAQVQAQTTKLPRPIVVRLIRKAKRDEFLKAAKSRKNMSTTDLEVTGPTVKIFFNERLTKANRLLFRECRVRAKKHGYAFCWINQGAIYIRQQEGKSAQLIRSQIDLDRILSSNVP